MNIRIAKGIEPVSFKAFDQIVDAYAAEGFPHEIIGQWTLPANDVDDLIAAVQAEAPRKVLEVGTFVGLSTMLIALAGGPRTRIVSVDPNFPLRMEMSSMGSALGGVDADARTQDVAARVARRLGLTERIEFVAGGFSAGATFSSRGVDPRLVIPVVGAKVCAEFGPFDLAFIDGLHYSDIVASDLALAAAHLNPRGVALMHDCVGMWGTNVRAGINRFLVSQPNWRLLHPPFSALYRSIGMVFDANVRTDLAARLVSTPQDHSQQLSSTLRNFAAAALERLNPTSAIELHLGRPLLSDTFQSLLPTVSVDIESCRPQDISDLMSTLAGRKMVVSAGALDLVDDQKFAQIFTEIARSRACAIILRTPPGESGYACRYSRPLGAWLGAAEKAGLSLYELPSFDRAVSRFLFTANPAAARNNSALCGHIIAMPIGADFPTIATSELRNVRHSSPDDIDQRDLLEIHYGSAFQRLFHDQDALRTELATTQAEVKRLNEIVKDQADRGTSIHFIERARQLTQHDECRIQAKNLHVLRQAESAFSHCASEGGGSVCLLFADVPETVVVRRLITEPRVALICLPAESENAATLHDGKIVYFNSGSWRFPEDGVLVYYIGPLHRLSRSLLGMAWRSGVQGLYTRVAGSWLRVPLKGLMNANRVKQALVSSIFSVHERCFLLIKRSGMSRFIPKWAAPSLMSMEEGFSVILSGVTRNSDFVAGRIVHVCGNLSPGGAERQAANSVIGLAQSGMQVLLLAHDVSAGNRHCDFHLERVLNGGVPVRQIAQKTTSLSDPHVPAAIRRVAHALPLSILLDIVDLAEELRIERPEIVHAWLDWDNVRAGLAAAIVGVPKIILSGRNLAPYHFKLHQPYMLPAYKALADLPNVIIVNNSRAGADSYADWIGVPRSCIRVLYNGFDPRPCAVPVSQDREALRLKAGFSPDDIVIGGVFRFEDEKRPALWIEAAAIIAKALPRARFVLYGQGSLRTQMIDLIDQLGLKSRVVFGGVTNEPLIAMFTMDVLLLTSQGEGLPNVLIEAQAVGTAVVTTRVGGAAEAIDPGVTGLLIEDETPQGIAAVVVGLCKDTDALAKARSAGPDLVMRKFGNDRMIVETRAIYSE